MEKIFTKDIIGRNSERSLLSHVILHCCSKEIIEKMKGSAGKEPEEDTRYIEVEFKMNGITTNLSDYLTHLEKDLDKIIEEKARDIVLEKLSGLDDVIYQIGEVIKDIVKDKLDVTLPEDEY